MYNFLFYIYTHATNTLQIVLYTKMEALFTYVQNQVMQKNKNKKTHKNLPGYQNILCKEVDNLKHTLSNTAVPEHNEL